MKKFKYQENQTVYKIDWTNINGYAVDGTIETFTVMRQEDRCDLDYPWYRLWDNKNKKFINEIEMCLHETEREAKEYIREALMEQREILKTTYETINNKLENSINNITNELM